MSHKSVVVNHRSNSSSVALIQDMSMGLNFNSKRAGDPANKSGNKSGAKRANSLSQSLFSTLGGNKGFTGKKEKRKSSQSSK